MNLKKLTLKKSGLKNFTPVYGGGGTQNKTDHFSACYGSCGWVCQAVDKAKWAVHTATGPDLTSAKCPN